MIKNNLSILAGAAMAGSVAFATAPTAHAASVVLDGQPFTTSVPPLDYNGRILVPMRDIFEELGATVSWTQYNQTIVAQRRPDGFHHGVSLTMQIGNPGASVNGAEVTLDQPPVLYYNYTLVPLRFVSEALGAQVDWDNVNQIAIIDTDDGHGHWYHGPGHYGNWPSGGANYWRQGGGQGAAPQPGYWPGGLPQGWNNGGYHPGPVFQPPYPGGQPDYGQYGSSHPNQHHPALATGVILGGLLALGLEAGQHGGGHGNGSAHGNGRGPVATNPGAPGRTQLPPHGGGHLTTSAAGPQSPVVAATAPSAGTSGKHDHTPKTETATSTSAKGATVKTATPEAKPAVAMPEVAKPEVTKPAVTKPAVVKAAPVATAKPVTVKPTAAPAAQAVVAKPVVAKPAPVATAKPVVAKPTPVATTPASPAPKGKKSKDKKPKPTPAP